jgi:hypothetical protein
LPIELANGITTLAGLQRTFATLSANSGHCRTTRTELRAAIRNAFDRRLIALAGRTIDDDDYALWLNLSGAIHLVARSSHAELRKLSREADQMGFIDQNLEDAKKAATRLARWQALLQEATDRK